MFQFSALALSRVTGLQPAGLSHSDTCGSNPVCRSPHIFAAYRVLRRRQKPRHPPFALCNFSCCESYLRNCLRRYVFSFLLYEKVVPNFFRFYRLSIFWFFTSIFSLSILQWTTVVSQTDCKGRDFFWISKFFCKNFQKKCIFLKKRPLFPLKSPKTGSFLRQESYIWV